MNLKYLSAVYILKSRDTDIVKCSPHLLKLKCKGDERLFPVLHYLTELEILRMDFRRRLEVDFSVIHFPSTLKKLCLSGFGLPWEEMSSIGRLPNLQVLKLEKRAFIGLPWETRDEEFQELRFLKLNLINIEQWTTYSEHFPKFRCLVLRRCMNLQEIPSELGNTPTLQRIEVISCDSKVNLSAAHIVRESSKKTMIIKSSKS